MALTKVTGQVINTSTDVTVGVLTVTNTLAVGGTVSIGGTLTYEDVTNIDSVGLITARNGIVVGSGITLSKDGDIFATGVTTATSFVGDGSALTGVASTENIRTNTNATFLQNINVSGSTTTGSLVSSGAISGTTGTFSGAVSGTTGTFSGDITANGNIVGDDSTNITGVNQVTIGDLYISENIVHRGDDNTRIRFPSADQVKIETAGTERVHVDGVEVVFNDTGVNTDLRIEGDSDANLFKVDASADAIGVGGVPGTTGMKMEIFRSTTDAFVNASDCVLRLLNTDTSANTNQTSLQFTTSTTGSGADSAIVSQAEDASGNSRLEFWTDTSNGMTEKLSITSAGYLQQHKLIAVSYSDTRAISLSDTDLTTSNFYNHTNFASDNSILDSNGHFVAPVHGIYRLYFRATTDGTSGNRANVRLRKNGNTVNEAYTNDSGGGVGYSVSSEIIMELNANEYFDIQVGQLHARSGNQHKVVNFHMLG